MKLTFDTVLKAIIYGVYVAYVKGVQKTDSLYLAMEKTIEAKINGVDGNFISKARIASTT
ncbi:hypothetical protein ACFSKU_18595 [Pontibacter silvestris]|uniref:Uncharacterized protein n=1 Tax=Pontibacter silvestris TaxID=2305183 RepID=A0ABW4X3Z1_9BACT|nr:hypothetical protein [Pontibacter silvestris]